MTSSSDDREVRGQERDESAEPVRYPTNHVLAVLDTEEQLTGAVEALTTGGFLGSEIHVATGAAAADRLGSSTGRSGLSRLAIRIAESLGVENTEMEYKSHYEEAMRDGRFVLRVAAPTDDRKQRATRVLQEHGAHAISYQGLFAIERLSPRRTESR